MGETDDAEPNLKSASRVSSSRFFSVGYGTTERAQSKAHANDKGLFDMRRNQSAGDGLELFSTRIDPIARSSFMQR